MDTIQAIVTKFDKVRSNPFTKERTQSSTDLAQHLYWLLNAEETLPERPPSMQGSEGEKLYYVCHRICEVHRTNYGEPQLILDLLDVYCRCSVATVHQNHFLGDLARTALHEVFAIPSPGFFSCEDILAFRKYLNQNYWFVPAEEEHSRHLAFLEVLAKFFLAYSEVVWRHIQSLPPKLNLQVAWRYQDSFTASLLGQAQGDALGFLVEGQEREVAEKYVNDVVRPGRYSEYGVHVDFGSKGEPRYVQKNSGPFAFAFGQYTDDTQLCRELIQTIARNGGRFRAKDFSRRLIALFEKSELLRGPTGLDHSGLGVHSGIVGFGRATRDSVQCLADGISWEQTGSMIRSQGNGGCMRVAPLGPLFLEQPWKLREIASAQALSTHGSSRCRATCVMVAEAARLAAESKICPWSAHLATEPELFCMRLADAVRSVDTEVAQAVLHVPQFLQEADERKMVLMITAKGKELGDSLWNDGKVLSASAVQTALFAICCFLRHPDSFKQAVCMAICAGGDTDTTAAITGAITAARTHDVANIKVFDGNYWGNDDLEQLSHEARAAVLNSVY